MRAALRGWIWLVASLVGCVAQSEVVDLAFPDLQLGGSSRVHAVAFEPGGKIIIAGDFTSILGVARPNIARLNREGTLDLSFTPPTGFNVANCVAVQADGKVIVTGGFTSPRNRIARLNADGSLDGSFNPNPNSAVECLALQNDGRILIGGQFTTLQPNGAATATSRRYIARLNADGTLDPGFDPRCNTRVSSVAVQSDGKVLIAGSFTTLQPNGAATATNRSGIARVTAEGALDTVFNPNPNSSVSGVAVQGDGKIVLSGDFTFLRANGAATSSVRNYIARVNEDGSLDASFDPNANGSVRGTAIRADGKILLGGFFTALRPNGAAAAISRVSAAQVFSDGTLDLDFSPNPSSYLNGVALQSDGKPLLIGFFSTLQPPGAPSPLTRTRAARLLAEPITSAISIPDATRVRWWRGGALPETQQATFELSTDGGVTFAPLGNGVRIAGGWERTGLSLPARGEIRARARTTGALSNGSSGLVEEIVYFGDVAPEIAVEQPAGTALASGASVAFGSPLVGDESTSLTFTLRNLGTASLSGLEIAKDGPDAAMFAVAASPNSPLIAGGTTTFTIRFTPTSIGAKTATLRILNNDPDENPFEIVVTGTGIGSTNANLSALSLERGTLNPNFSGSTTSYAASVPYVSSSITLRPTVAQSAATVKVNGNSVVSGRASAPILLSIGLNQIETVVTAGDGVASRTYTVAVTRAAPLPGEPDPLVAAVDGTVYSAITQADGRIVLAGEFTAVLGVPRSNLARLNTDGTLDTTFDPNPNARVSCVVAQPDGKLIIAGLLTRLEPDRDADAIYRRYIARLNPNGSPDEFNPQADSPVHSLALQADGRVLVGGEFTSFRPNLVSTDIERQYLARLHPDGTLDLDFAIKANQAVYSIAVQPDGKIVLGGWFTRIEARNADKTFERNHIARLNADATLDEGFDPSANGIVNCVAIQPDGKVLLGGEFSTLQPNGAPAIATRRDIARVHADGSLDTGFNPMANHFVSTIAMQANGKILLGGGFTTLQPNGAPSPTVRERVARLLSDGTLDPVFDPKANGHIKTLAVQSDGKLLIGGGFSAFYPNGTTAFVDRQNFARLFNDPAAQSLSAPDSSQILWQRSGATGEVVHATFELSTDGGATWLALGPAIRSGNVTGTWHLSGLTLPASGHLRARGIAPGGFQNGSSSVIEQVAPFATTPYGRWKLALLGDANAPDDGNLDADAFTTLAEYGLVLSPTAFSAGPVSERFSYPDGERLRILFTRDPARNDITTEILAADDLAGPWSVIARSSPGALTAGPGYVAGDSLEPGLKTIEVRDVLDIGDPAHPRRFLRLRVSR